MTSKLSKVVYIAVIAIAGIILYRILFKSNDTISVLQYNSELIEKQIKNVSKLIVSEGQYAEVVTYKDNKKYFSDLFTFEKKALVIINAKALVSYDLRQLKYSIDQESKTVKITQIPSAELEIIPEIQFYDINQSTFNTFTGEDYNKISKSVKKDLERKILKSNLMTNAENRLISELSNILFITNSLGWKLVHNNNTINELNKNILL